MNDILDIVRDHQYIDDIAGTSIPVQIKSRTDMRILSFYSPSSQKLLRTMLRNMKLPIMMKKYFDAYTLYIGQNSLQIFANFEPDPPFTSSRISSITPSEPLPEDEESDNDSGVGRGSPIHQDDSDSSDEEQQEAEAQDD